MVFHRQSFPNSALYLDLSKLSELSKLSKILQNFYHFISDLISVRLLKMFKQNYTVEELIKAKGEIQNNISSIRQASKKYKIPFSTLQRKIKDNSVNVCNRDPKTYISPELENKLAVYILGSASRGIVCYCKEN